MHAECSPASPFQRRFSLSPRRAPFCRLRVMEADVFGGRTIRGVLGSTNMTISLRATGKAGHPMQLPARLPCKLSQIGYHTNYTPYIQICYHCYLNTDVLVLYPYNKYMVIICNVFSFEKEFYAYLK